VTEQPFGETQPLGEAHSPGGDYLEFGGPPRRPGPRRHVLSVAVVAVVALLGGAGVAYAVSGGGSSPQTTAAAGASTSPSPAPSGPVRLKCDSSKGACRAFGIRPFGRIGGPFGGMGLGAGLPGGLVHGQVVVSKPGGGYETVDIQSGKVTSVSSTSITIKSADGYSATYVVAASTIVDAQRDGIGSVKTGNEVSLTATVSEATATASSITDLSLLTQGSNHAFPWGSGGTSPGGYTS